MIAGISDRSVFAEIRTAGHHVRSADLRLRYLPGELGTEPQVAYAISRKVGNAVTRNRIRRRLRASLGEHFGRFEVAPLRAAVLIVLPGASDRSYAELNDQVRELMKKVEKSSLAADRS